MTNDELCALRLCFYFKTKKSPAVSSSSAAVPKFDAARLPGQTNIALLDTSPENHQSQIVMFSKLCVAALVASVAAKTSWNQLENYSFDQFIQEFGLKFTPTELETRRALFSAELARVRAHNAKGLSWKEGVNKFSAMTAAEKRNYHGISKSANKLQQNSLQHAKGLPEDFQMLPLERLPKIVDWRKEGIVSAVKDQGHCGSCW